MSKDRLSPLNDAHVAAGAKLVEFAGWMLPIHYGSQVEEHHAVRRGAGVFDVSHMTIIDLSGDGTESWLRTLLSCDVARLDDGEALYGCLCNESGGVLDDLITYRIDERHWRLIVNAATRDKVIAWLEGHRSTDVVMTVWTNRAMLVVQGPGAVSLAAEALAACRESVPAIAMLERFQFARDEALFVARTGYTGEDGVEIELGAADAPAVWDALMALGVVPCGLGARDTLRLEAGMSLYGSDLNEEHSPVESGLSWAVDLRDETRDFIGREVVEDHKMFGAPTRRVGLSREARGVLRAGQRVQLAGKDVGYITSGTFSPTLKHTIALARVSREFHGCCDVVVRDRLLSAALSRVPFVRAGAGDSADD